MARSGGICGNSYVKYTGSSKMYNVVQNYIRTTSIDRFFARWRMFGNLYLVIEFLILARIFKQCKRYSLFGEIGEIFGKSIFKGTICSEVLSGTKWYKIIIDQFIRAT